MAFRFIVCFFGIAATLTKAAAAPKTYKLHERRDTSSPSTWIKKTLSDRHHVIPVRVGLVQTNLDRAEDLLMAISDPSSASYGKHYSSQQVTDLFAPTAEAINYTRDWLESEGVSMSNITLSANKIWLQFDAKISQLESLLHTTYFEFEDPVTGVVTLACDSYHVPANVSRHVDLIKPGVSLIKPIASPASFGRVSRIDKRHGVMIQEKRHLHQRRSAGRNCAGAVTPDCFFEMYNIPKGKLKNQPNNSIGVYEMTGEFYSQQALNGYLESFTNIPIGTTPDIKLVDGARSPVTLPRNTLTGEATLDVEMVFPLAYPDTIEYYQVNTYMYNKYKGLFNTFLDALDGSYCNYTAFGIDGDSPGVDQTFPDPNKGGYKGQLQCGVYKPPKVISISYGYNEKSYSTAYQRRQCNEFMKLSLRGTTIVISSGDYGVQNTGACGGVNHTVFNPSNPSGCPYILSVGATRLPPGAIPGKDKEEASNTFGSGGGFSNIFPRPKYQAHAVERYLQNYPPDYPSYKTKYNASPNQTVTGNGRYNRAGRGYPDIAAVGQSVAGWIDGIFYGYGDGSAILFDGTSASAPIVAGVITRINNHRLAAGKSSVGFVHPVLYSHPDILNDVIKGQNNPPGSGKKGTIGCGTTGFDCAPGWDPVTGLGTPNFEKMLKVFMSLP